MGVGIEAESSRQRSYLCGRRRRIAHRVVAAGLARPAPAADAAEPPGAARVYSDRPRRADAPRGHPDPDAEPHPAEEPGHLVRAGAGGLPRRDHPEPRRDDDRRATCAQRHRRERRTGSRDRGRRSRALPHGAPEPARDRHAPPPASRTAGRSISTATVQSKGYLWGLLRREPPEATRRTRTRRAGRRRPSTDQRQADYHPNPNSFPGTSSIRTTTLSIRRVMNLGSAMDPVQPAVAALRVRQPRRHRPRRPHRPGSVPSPSGGLTRIAPGGARRHRRADRAARRRARGDRARGTRQS